MYRAGLAAAACSCYAIDQLAYQTQLNMGRRKVSLPAALRLP